MIGARIGGPEPVRSFYFPSREAAGRFRDAVTTAARSGSARTVGRVVVRKTLAERREGSAVRRDPRHVDGYVVRVRPFAFSDLEPIARLARDAGAIPAPFTGAGR